MVMSVSGGASKGVSGNVTNDNRTLDLGYQDHVQHQHRASVAAWSDGVIITCGLASDFVFFIPPPQSA